MRTLIIFCAFCFTCYEGSAQAVHRKPYQSNRGFVKIIFRNTINGEPVVLNDSIYTNPFEEKYSIKKLKYYVSNFQFSHAAVKKSLLVKQCWLINQAVDSSLSFTISVSADEYQEIGFLSGVDSALNTSGAQTGALDPLNDMFWTWHSGYIMEKLEGTSPQSKVVNNKIEYHIGGFSGENNVLNKIWLGTNLSVQKGKTTTIIINADIGKFWNAQHKITISETPVCTSPGILAKQIAENFSSIFSIADIIYQN